MDGKKYRVLLETLKVGILSDIHLSDEAHRPSKAYVWLFEKTLRFYRDDGPARRGLDRARSRRPPVARLCLCVAGETVAASRIPAEAMAHRRDAA